MNKAQTESQPISNDDIIDFFSFCGKTLHHILKTIRTPIEIKLSRLNNEYEAGNYASQCRIDFQRKPLKRTVTELTRQITLCNAFTRALKQYNPDDDSTINNIESYGNDVVTTLNNLALELLSGPFPQHTAIPKSFEGSLPRYQSMAKDFGTITVDIYKLLTEIIDGADIQITSPQPLEM